MLFKVRTIGLHAVLLCHSLKAQQGYMWIQSAEGMPWNQVLSLLPLVWFLGPITTYLAAFPGTSRPSILAFLDAIFADPVRIGPSWGTVRLPLFIHFFSFISKFLGSHTMQAGSLPRWWWRLRYYLCGHQNWQSTVRDMCITYGMKGRVSHPFTLLASISWGWMVLSLVQLPFPR